MPLTAHGRVIAPIGPRPMGAGQRIAISELRRVRDEIHLDASLRAASDKEQADQLRADAVLIDRAIEVLQRRPR